MKKAFVVLISMIVLFTTLPLGTVPVSAGTQGDFTYKIVSGEAIITMCSTWAQGKITIPSTLEGCPVTAIYSSAFLNCHDISCIVIPSSITKIEPGAFFGCKVQLGFEVDDDNVNYYNDQQGVLYDKNKATLLKAPDAIESCVIPDNITAINGHAFSLCRELTTITIGQNVIDIGGGAFSDCVSLTSVVIPDSVVTIGDAAFSDCSNLTNVIIGKSVTTIGVNAFARCNKLLSVVVPDNVTKMAGAFNYCSGLNNIALGSGITSISYAEFAGCSQLTTVTLSDRIRYIGNEAFKSCAELDVYYQGTESQWNKISIGENNFILLNRATIHFNHTHEYDNVCDVECNACGFIRVPADHSYDHAYDHDCNICGHTREVPDMVAGDANGDGKINVKDLGLLQQKLNGWDVEPIMDACDVNSDGKINVKDLGLLQQYLNGWDVELK